MRLAHTRRVGAFVAADVKGDAVNFDDACRILSQEEFAARLLAAGWTKVTCKACDGIGHFRTSTLDEGHMTYVCEHCNGSGQIWKEPPATKQQRQNHG